MQIWTILTIQLLLQTNCICDKSNDYHININSIQVEQPYIQLSISEIQDSYTKYPPNNIVDIEIQKRYRDINATNYCNIEELNRLQDSTTINDLYILYKYNKYCNDIVSSKTDSGLKILKKILQITKGEYIPHNIEYIFDIISNNQNYINILYDDILNIINKITRINDLSIYNVIYYYNIIYKLKKDDTIALPSINNLSIYSKVLSSIPNTIDNIYKDVNTANDNNNISLNTIYKYIDNIINLYSIDEFKEYIPIKQQYKVLFTISNIMIKKQIALQNDERGIFIKSSLLLCNQKYINLFMIGDSKIVSTNNKYTMITKILPLCETILYKDNSIINKDFFKYYKFYKELNTTLYLSTDKNITEYKIQSIKDNNIKESYINNKLLELSITDDTISTIPIGKNIITYNLYISINNTIDIISTIKRPLIHLLSESKFHNIITNFGIGTKLTGDFKIMGTSIQNIHDTNIIYKDKYPIIKIDTFTNDILRIIVKNSNDSILDIDILSCIIRIVNTNTKEIRLQPMRKIIGNGYTYSAIVSKYQFLKMINGPGIYDVYIDINSDGLLPSKRINNWKIFEIQAINGPYTNNSIIHTTHDLYDNEYDIEIKYPIKIREPIYPIVYTTLAILIFVLYLLQHTIITKYNNLLLHKFDSIQKAGFFLLMIVSTISFIIIYFFYLKFYHVLFIAPILISLLSLSVYISVNDITFKYNFLKDFHTVNTSKKKQ